MKKIIYLVGSILLIGIIAFISFFNLKDNKRSDLKKVRVSEVAHSIFYAPQYVAINNGYFEELGIDIELTLTPGADNLATESVT